MKTKSFILLTFVPTILLFAGNYNIVDTGQKDFFGNNSYISKPKSGENYFGQDASYLGNQFNYSDNKDGTITDNITALMWAKKIPSKLSFDEALSYSKTSRLGGYSDWRIPTIKELYSLINFNGTTGRANPSSSKVPSDARPYLDTRYFDFEYPSERRYIDAQYWTSTDYVSTTMNGAKTFFGVNFADGRIKGYPKYKAHGGTAKFYLRLVRGNINYGKNIFVDKKDGTVFDKATNLLWTKSDSRVGMDWRSALEYCENLNYAGVSTWRLPNAKELQSIVDYTKSPDTTNSAAISSIFESSSIINEGGKKDYPSYWSSTTHLDGKNIGSQGIYVSFGRSLGYMSKPNTLFSSKKLMDVHGAGAQRSDPKSGNVSNYSNGRGPQGDVVRIYNYVRCVSDNFSKIDSSIRKKELLGKSLNSSEIEKPIFNKYSKSFEPKVINKKTKNPILDRFDRNRDGKISLNEAPQKMRENFHRHDLDRNGFIEGSEFETLPKRR